LNDKDQTNSVHRKKQKKNRKKKKKRRKTKKEEKQKKQKNNQKFVFRLYMEGLSTDFIFSFFPKWGLR